MDHPPHAGVVPPRNPVTITRAYLIATTKVTQGLWKAVMGTNPSRFASGGRDCPVENVTWLEAIEFCNRLSERESLSPCYVVNGGAVGWNSCTGYRLPTEAEWEFAAPAAGRPIGWPPEREGRPPERRGCPKEVWPGPVPVDCMTRNPLGLYGMFEGVAEWCWDWLGETPSVEPAVDPEGAGHGSRHVFRGRGWCRHRPDCLPADRIPPQPDLRSYDLGLRVVRPAF